MRADQMLNALPDANQSLIYKRKKLSQKKKSIELTNFSAIQLNPWHDETPNTFAYLEAQNFFSSPKLPSTYTPTFNETPEKYQFKNKQKQLSNKKWSLSQTQKHQTFSSKQQRLRQKKQKEINFMNKTISVNNIQSDKIFNQTNSFIKERKSLKFEGQQNFRKTVISNPMYLKFCNPLKCNDQKLTRRKKTISDFNPKTIDFDSQNVIKIKQKMHIFSSLKGDVNKARNIHQVRRRLNSNSQISKRSSFSDKKNETEHFTCEIQKIKTCDIIETPNVLQTQQQEMTKKNNSNENIQLDQVQQKKISFKLGQRKNLYIGYRKFFHPLYHVIGKDRKISFEDQSSDKK